MLMKPKTKIENEIPSTSSDADEGFAKSETYIFERIEGRYQLELKDDAAARINAALNPGTLKVTTKSGRPVWPH